MASRSLGWILVLFACACSDAGDPSEHLLRFCESFVAVECENERLCGSPKAACRAACDDPAWQRSFDRLEHGRVHYDPVAASECLASMRARACTSFEVCGEVLLGDVEPGGGCGTHADCAGEAICIYGETCPGICAALPGPGAPCETECTSDAFCSVSERRCIAYADGGDGCDGDRYIRPLDEPVQRSALSKSSFRICALPFQCTEGRCVEPPRPRELARGERCVGESAARCGEGLYCSYETGSCTESGKDGAPCPDWIWSNPAEDDTCRQGLTCTDERCGPIAREGDACTGTGCVGGSLACVAGACRAAGGLGDPCDPARPTCGISSYDPAYGMDFIYVFCDEASMTCLEDLRRSGWDSDVHCEDGRGTCFLPICGA